MSNIELMKESLKGKEKDYKGRNYFGNLSDLLADIVHLRIRIERAEGLENDKNGKDTDGNLDNE